MLKTFVVFRQPGTGWVEGTPTRQQPLWDEHAVFMDRVFDSSAIVLGGPFADHMGALLIIEAETATAVRRMLRDDPWETNDILVTGDVREWLIFLDSREKQSD